MSAAAEQIRAAFFAAQSLPAGRRTPVEVVTRSGFLRTLGGVDVYLALRARIAGFRRAAADAAAEAGELQILPSVRGCMYLVPRAEAAWCLRMADLLSAARREREHQKAGIRRGEIEKVGQAVLAILTERGALTTDGIRQALPKGALRSLGDAGKKVGLSSPLPPALRLLEFEGRIERAPEGGRLDTERYQWRVAPANPFDADPVPGDPVAVYAHFAERFFSWAAIGTAGAFAEWAGISKRDAKAALERLPLTPVEARGLEGEWLVLESTASGRGAGSAARGVALLPFEDNLLHLHGPAALVEPRYHQVAVPSWGSARPVRLGEARHMSFRSIVADGYVVGFWEFEPDRGEVVQACFAKVPRATRDAIEAEAVAVARFIQEELGHGRSFSLDTEEELRKRARQLAAFAA
jgi:hypothetical protein